MTLIENVLATMQQRNAELYQASQLHRPELSYDDRLLWIQQKLAREYQHIARMSHWVCLERYQSLAELVVPEQVLDPEYDAAAEAVEWLQARAKPACTHPLPWYMALDGYHCEVCDALTLASAGPMTPAQLRDQLDLLTEQARQMREERRRSEQLGQPVGVRDEMPLMRPPERCACDLAEVTLANARETQRLMSKLLKP